MVKFARLVIEAEIEDDATDDEALQAIDDEMEGIIGDNAPLTIRDIEICEYSYQETMNIKKTSR